jgi:signal transduction histidine kinase
VSPGANLAATPPAGRLFVLASDFPAQPRCASSNLPLSTSVTGRAVWSRSLQIEDELHDRGGDEGACPFLASCGAVMAAPVTLREEKPGALSVYRRRGLRFAMEELRRFEEISGLFPLLYRAIRDRINSQLLEAVRGILHEAEVRSRGRLLPLEEKKRVFKTICTRIAESLHCREASLFLYDCREISLLLDDHLEEAVSYTLMATTLPEPLGKVTYIGDVDDGLTGWVLAHSKPAWIFDLERYTDDEEWIQRLYPGLRWKDGISIRALVAQLLGQRSEDLPYPICVLAVPVTIGDKVLGVIRCSIAEDPYYFSEFDLDLLQLVAAQMAQCWSGWLGRREMAEENASWLALVDHITHLNDFVQTILEQEDPDETRIYDEALRQIDRVIPGADVNSVRLVIPETQELAFVAINGRSWEERDRARIQSYRSSIVGETPPSAGAHVLRTKAVYLIPDTKRDPHYHRNLFPKTRKTILCPIKDRSDVLGVLDVRSYSADPFPKHAAAVAALLGRQLGLYHRLAATIVQLRRGQRQQVLTWADVSHQLKGPINQAKARADRALEESGNEFTHLRAVRGLCRKAKRVVTSLGLYADLASDKPIRLNRVCLDFSLLIKMLIEASQDAEFLIDPRRNVRFQVNRSSFAFPLLSRVEVDHDLLEQAVSNLLDNAGKYSFKNTRVEVYGGLTNTRRFHLTVRNQGLRIRPHEVRECVTREWRGDEAKLTTQEGSGLGLWIVDNIMKAHRGELLVVPTTADDMTEVKLIFPLSGAEKAP